MTKVIVLKAFSTTKKSYSPSPDIVEIDDISDYVQAGFVKVVKAKRKTVKKVS